jgi:hypothetical protein
MIPYPLREGFCLFAAPLGDDMVSEARSYVAQYKLSQDDVRIVKTDSQILVVTKREIMWGEK